MILKSLKMKNIRSYTSPERLDFPPGSVLLAGDIGAGKSTVLHAIDFALFGLQTDLSGGSLLRRGEKQGQVDLHFVVNGGPCRIVRNLERKRGSISDAGGFIEVDGTRRNHKAVDLKVAVLELLGYPTELAEKRHNLIYKYTVYTPQEEMKLILIGDASARLETLRRTFGIEAYRRIQENSKKLLTFLNSEIRTRKTQFAELDARKSEMETRLEEMKKLKEELKGILSAQRQIGKTVDGKKKEIGVIEGKIKNMYGAREELKGESSERKVVLKAVDDSKREIEELKKAKKDLSSSVEGFSELVAPKHSEGQLKRLLDELRSGQELKTQEASVLGERISSLQKILEEGKCGTCEQEVADPSLFMDRIEKKKASKHKIEAELKKIKGRVAEAEAERDSLRKYEKKQKERESIETRLEEVDKRLKARVLELKKREDEVERLTSTITELEEQIRGFGNLEKEHSRLKGEWERLLRQESGIEKRRTAMEKDIEHLGKEVERLKADVKRMEDIKRQHAYLREVTAWLSKLFSNLVASIEKQVMTSILVEFDSLFQEWFRLLVEDEALLVRLDEAFSPVIMQNGYDTDYESLSGGEKTSIALAYRLSLNKVINTLVEEVKTKDLLILDEPTDGFSREQLYKVRDVLSRLNTRQTIIVSHEPEIEGFVENTIRFYKENHVSNFAYSRA